jgi:NAD(P)H-dependent FMN reductase
MPKLHVVIASTRPGRVGPSIANWFFAYAQTHGKFDVELVDLAEVGLPLYDEAAHPASRQYEHEHTQRWSAKVAEGDAFVFVLPEYDFGMPPSLLNALIYLYHEWSYKPAAFVSYGGVSGGLRAVQDAKLALTSFKMVPLVEAVTIPFFSSHIDETGEFTPNELHLKSAETLLNELRRWSEALAVLRQ